MTTFMDEDFLLKSPSAQTLYHQYAKDKPIYDYHSHLDPKAIWEDRRYENITQLWLGEDHYKWRAMRLNGIEEKYITGDGTDYEKFLAYAKTIEQAIGNPLYHWTHLELKRYFGIHEPLKADTAKAIFDQCNEVIKKDDFSVRKLLKRTNVVYVATTDDPVSTLDYHQLLKEDKSCTTKVRPTFRPDQVVEIGAPTFKNYMKELEKVSGLLIKNLGDLEEVLRQRIDFFNEAGCCSADHGISVLPECVMTRDEVNEVFQKVINEEPVSKEEMDGYRMYLLTFFGKAYSELGWIMQLHIGAMRNNSSKMFHQLGPDQGFDSAGDGAIAQQLSRILNLMESQEGLPKTVLYTLNPIHNYALGTMLGNFSTDSVRGKIQFGASWWFGDHKQGIENHMIDLASLGLLGNFIGMLTDSRSFLSMPRHEYFRRILCNLIGSWVEEGELPNDLSYLGGLVEAICYKNIEAYLKI